MKRFFSKPTPSTRRLIVASYSASLLLALSACGPIHVDGLPHVSLGDDVSASAQPHLLGQFIDDRIMSVPDTAKTYGQAWQNADAVDAALMQLADMEPSKSAVIRVGISECASREKALIHGAKTVTASLRIQAAQRHEACAKGLATELRPSRT
ncbi:hypothetical protein [Acetobacter senegalensis]|uniref:hypothetical protein n=1 Tax=Acetobacter senegalensis TaxID=446692 RepID=UPI0026569E92|nr:hypothetical protein [Acetobacter senegalensis]MDN7350003.1 hypothetical protein [Acetobacter senegalensis]